MQNIKKLAACENNQRQKSYFDELSKMLLKNERAMLERCNISLSCELVQGNTNLGSPIYSRGVV